MDIQSIQQVQDRIKEIKSRFKTIQSTYSKVNPSPGVILPENKGSQLQKETDMVNSTVESQKNNTNNIKVTEEILKNVLNVKKENNKESIDVQQIQSLLQKAITQYTSNGKIFNIEE